MTDDIQGSMSSPQDDFSQNQDKNSKQNKVDLTQGDLLYHLRRLSLPMVLGIFAIVSTTLVDTYYISLLGTDELVAISFAFTLSFAVFSFILGLGIGMSSVLSRAIGAGDMQAAQRLTLHCLVVGAIFSVIITFAGLVSQKYIFKAIGADDHILVLVLEYMDIWLFGIILVTMPIIGNAAMRASGDSFSPGMIMVLAAIVNLILDPILIFGYFGFPALGMQGAALASVIAYAISMIPALYILAVPKKMLFQTAPQWHLLGQSAHQFLSIGIPAGLANMIQPLSNAFVVALLAYVSNEAVAGYGVSVRIQSFVLIPVMALATGMSPIIGQNWGAGRFDRVNETLSKSLAINAVWCGLTAILLAIFSAPIAGAFSSDKAVISAAQIFLWILPVTYIGAQTIQLWCSAFNAAGYPKRAFIILNVKIIGLYIPASYIGSLYGGVIGVACGLAIVNVFAGLGFHILNSRFCSHKQTELKQAEAQLA